MTNDASMCVRLLLLFRRGRGVAGGVGDELRAALRQEIVSHRRQ